MRIAYVDPWRIAWDKMKLALFKPFDLGKWFAVGFSAFLAGLMEGWHGSAGSRYSHEGSWREFLDFPGRAWGWLNSHPFWFTAILIGAAAALAIGIVLLWVSSRAKFMFLDNVIHNAAEIRKPWEKFRREGNSLFAWTLVFGIITFAVFIAFAVFFFIGARQLYEVEPTRWLSVPLLVGLGLLFFFLILILGYIALFLNGFVVPLMYKGGLTARQAWARFLALLGRAPLQFILYGLVVFVLYLLFVAAVVMAGIVTCCIGWLLLAIPYIGTVVTLPFWYTLRAFSVEFLGQFGPEYALFPAPMSQPQAPPGQA